MDVAPGEGRDWDSEPKRVKSLPYPRSTRVTAPNGTFDVFWYARAQEILDATCDDAVHQVPMVGFIASRVASP